MSTFNQDDFCDYEQVGSGGEGAVFRAKTKIFGVVAVKVFAGKENLREIENMQKFSHHPNIIQYFGTVEVGYSFPPRYGYVMKYMPDGSVYDAIHAKKLKYSIETAYSWILQAARGIAYLHHNNIIHRDIKPSNMLFSDSFKTVIISDFGLAKVDEQHISTSFQGSTYCYMAPEIFQNLIDYSKSSDVFSFSISMWEIVTKRIPYEEYTHITDDLILRTEVISGTRPSLNLSLDSDLRELLRSAWNTESVSRPTIENLVTFFDERKSTENLSAIDQQCEDLYGESKSNSPSGSQITNESPTGTSKKGIETIGYLPEFYDKIPDETTILVLGEVGAGNNSFVSGLFNHLKYGTFEEAMKNGVDILIQETFIIMDNGNKREVTCDSTLRENILGSDSNLGTSTTQRCTSYKFLWGPPNKQKSMKIVYTPEIGACGSREQYNIYENSTDVIAGLREVNAICVCLNCRETQNTPTFYSCLGEILGHFSTSVSNNVFFFFDRTNPSDCDLKELKKSLHEMETMRAIKIPLNEQTMFYFDIESYQFLCALRKGFKFPKYNPDVLKDKWKMTSESIFKLLKLMSCLPPCTVETTELPNSAIARGVLCELTRGLIVLARIKTLNIQIINDKLGEIEDYNRDAKREVPLLSVDKILLTLEKTSAPKLFCPSITSGEQRIYEKEKFPSIVYKFKNGFPKDICTHCECSFECHTSIKYELKETKTKREIYICENSNSLLQSTIDVFMSVWVLVTCNNSLSRCGQNPEVEMNTNSQHNKTETTRPFMIRIKAEKKQLYLDIEHIVDSFTVIWTILKKTTVLHEDDPYIEYVKKVLQDAQNDDNLKEIFHREKFPEITPKLDEPKLPLQEIHEFHERLTKSMTIDNGNILVEIWNLQSHRELDRETVVDITSISYY